MKHDYHNQNDSYNGVKYRTGKNCVEGCGRPAGTWWSPYWCWFCNAQRMDRISKQLKDMVNK